MMILHSESDKRMDSKSIDPNRKMVGHVRDLTGQTFGRLTVIKRMPYNTKDRKAMWLCKCECGGYREVMGSNLLAGHTKSCGCLYDEEWERRRKINEQYKDNIYSVWCGIKKRCYTTNNRNYLRYGGRGIKMCEEWRTNPNAFIDWALANGYKKGLTIDRIDNDGDYCPENCQILTKGENARKARPHYQVGDASLTTHEISKAIGKRKTYMYDLVSRLGKKEAIERINIQLKERGLHEIAI